MVNSPDPHPRRLELPRSVQPPESCRRGYRTREPHGEGVAQTPALLQPQQLHHEVVPTRQPLQVNFGKLLTKFYLMSPLQI